MRYPFSPAVLDAMPEELAELYRALELKLLEEIASRLKIADSLNEVTIADIRALRSHGISLPEIKKAIQEAADISEAKLNELLNDAVRRNQRYFTQLITLADITAPETLVNAQTIDAIKRQTQDTMRNITQSMGFLVGDRMLPPAEAYQWALDNAALQMQSGAISYTQAIAEATRQLADSGLRVVTYESGHKDHVDVAVRRAVMTGVGQINEQYNTQSLEYLETDLVEVSAHAGARNTGFGFQNHESWQGKVYRWSKYPRVSKGDYPDFERTCGLGDVQGIHGANCRHWYSPFIEGIMEPTYTQKDLDALKADTKIIEYDGEKYDRYQATQKQREIERAIRKQKRRQAAATNEIDALTAKSKERVLRQKYREFSKLAGLREQPERMKIYDK